MYLTALERVLASFDFSVAILLLLFESLRPLRKIAPESFLIAG